MKSLYLIAILPPPEVAQRIDHIRKECSEKYQVFKALKPPVHITLYKPVWIGSDREALLIESMRLVGRGSRSFTLNVENFARFDKRVLYLKALSNPEIVALQHQIATVFRDQSFDKNAKIDQHYHPHFTLAYRDITPDKFDEIWKEYKDRKFSENFSVVQFSILKHDGKKWQVLEDLSLNP